MKEFPLGNSLVAKVDDEDWEMLIQFRWNARRSRRKTVSDTWYAETIITHDDGTIRRVSMHQMIMRPPAKMLVDHIDHDGLNNQRSNLRVCSNAQNLRNKRSKVGSLPKGVFRVRSKKYGAQIVVDGRKYYNGLNHVTPEVAALAYNELAIKHHGEFALLNPTAPSAYV